MRNSIAALLAPLLLAAGLTACSSAVTDGPITVLGPWIDDDNATDDEHDVFSALLAEYGEKHGLSIRYQGTRAIGPVIRSKAKDGQLPDIAIMPNVGELALYATEGRAEPVTDMVSTARPDTDPVPPDGAGVRVDHRALWRGDRAYAVAAKTDLKSLILFRSGTTPPATLAELTEAPSGAEEPQPWCLGLSASSSPGWPGTDWIEDILLHQAESETYQKWASGELEWTSDEVIAAWEAWLPILRAGSRSVEGGPLVTSPAEAAGALRDSTCAMLHQSAFFVRSSSAEEISFAPFPATEPATRAQTDVAVAGDFAALFSDRPEVKDLLTYLTDATAGGADWVERSQGAVYSVNVQPELSSYSHLSRNVAKHLKAAAHRCLDASDAMPATMAAAFHNAVLEYAAYPDTERLTSKILPRLEVVRKEIQPEEKLRVTCSA